MINITSVYVTESEKSQLPRTQQPDTLFTIKWFLYTLTNNSARYWCWELRKLICCGLFLRLVGHPWVLRSPSNGFISPWQADSQLWFTTWLADVFGHGFSYFVWYVEVKMAPMDAIWLFQSRHSLCMPLYGYPPIPALPPYRSASGIGYTSKAI